MFMVSVFEGVLYLLLALFLAAFCIPLFIHGAPYVPVHKKRIDDMLRAAGITIADRVADIGSGDGRFVIGAARLGAQAVGYEINPFLVWVSRLKIRFLRLQDLAQIRLANIWHVNFSDFTVVILFGFPYMMERLEKKLRYELPKGARVVSFAFKFPTWVPKSSEKGVYLYVNE